MRILQRSKVGGAVCHFLFFSGPTILASGAHQCLELLELVL
jgi:hypothetical protein